MYEEPGREDDDIVALVLWFLDQLQVVSLVGVSPYVGLLLQSDSKSVILVYIGVTVLALALFAYIAYGHDNVHDYVNRSQMGSPIPLRYMSWVTLAMVGILFLGAALSAVLAVFA